MNPDLHARIEKSGLSDARRHLFLCTGPKCCSETDGLATWSHLKFEVDRHQLPVLRTKAACLRLCQEGPWLVVYPEGIWYSGVTPERFDRIRREHLEGGQPVSEWVRIVHPLDEDRIDPPKAGTD